MDNINDKDESKKNYASESFSKLHLFKAEKEVPDINNMNAVKKPKKKDNLYTDPPLHSQQTNIKEPVWLSVSESAKFGGIQTKTIRRALQANKLVYKIVKDRYLIDLKSLLSFLYSTKKLANKLNQFGVGQYIDNWKE